ncbi:MAG TPA: glycosyltransferase family 4 protein [Solirubrobacteraceae bacterium]|nr:glycosyltransferase family 4 protein [Solirubrobacteraceae bacterium]
MDELRIAVLAPPWIEVPAPAYGGIEEVVRLEVDGLVARGHDVTLFAPPGSDTPARAAAPLSDTHPDEIERCVWEVDHVARAFDAIDQELPGGRRFDVVHDHCGFAGLAFADRLRTPLVHTMHGPLDEATLPFYATHAPKGTVVAISHAQLDGAPPALEGAPVVHNPLAFAEWKLETDPGEHVLWIGRMNPVKGPHRAIAAAREAGVPLVLAGPVQPGQERFFAAEVEPHVDGEAVHYVGETGGADKAELYRSAAALLMPIRWREPFGLVMVEAMACGTPVIAFAEGSVPEVVEDGVSGFVVDDEHAMAAAIGRAVELDRAAVRASACERFDVERCVEGYERVFRGAVAGRSDNRRGRFMRIASR